MLRIGRPLSAVIGLLVTIAGATTTGSVAHAANATVNCSADPSALTAALSAATDGDTLTIQGRCRGNFEIQNNVTLVGIELPDPAIFPPMPGMGPEPGSLDGQGTGTVVTIHANKTVTISRLLISNGFSNVGGGGLWVNAGATVTVLNSVVHENALGPNGSGGGILNFGTLTLDNSHVWGNRAGNNGAGAGIRNTFGTLVVNRSGITGNRGGFAGAGISSTGTLVVNATTISSNDLALDAASNGAGVYHDGASATISDSTIVFNTAHNGGGGVYSVGDMTVRTSTIQNNVGIFGSGGGIYRVGGQLTVENSTFYGNRAEAGGGIADSASSFYGPLTLRNVTITNNTSTTSSGGGMFTLFGPNEIAHSTIIAGNVGRNCLFHLPGTSGGLADGGYNLADDATCGFTIANNSLPNTSPLFDPAGLRLNGGATSTVALLPASPAVNAIPIGVNGCGATLVRDQRGVTRPFGARCDIGAFELDRVVDTTPPEIAATLDPSPNPAGWNRSDVTLTWTVNDAESGIASTSGCETVTFVDDTAAATRTCSAANGAGLSSSVSATVKLDQTAPVVTFLGNAGAYTVSENIAITCTASDALSGVASSTCADVSQPAYTFPLGTSTLTATATDNADNTSSATTTFTVSVTPLSLCRLTSEFVRTSPKYSALTPAQKQLVDQLSESICTRITTLAASTTPAQKESAIAAYTRGVDVLANAGWITDAQRLTLKALANAI